MQTTMTDLSPKIGHGLMGEWDVAFTIPAASSAANDSHKWDWTAGPDLGIHDPSDGARTG